MSWPTYGDRALTGWPKYEDRREPKPCVSCGYVRTVKVRRRGHLKDGVPVWTEDWSGECTACDLERRARWYVREWQRFTVKAQKARAKQSTRAARAVRVDEKKE